MSSSSSEPSTKRQKLSKSKDRNVAQDVYRRQRTGKFPKRPGTFIHEARVNSPLIEQANRVINQRIDTKIKHRVRWDDEIAPWYGNQNLLRETPTTIIERAGRAAVDPRGKSAVRSLPTIISPNSFINQAVRKIHEGSPR